MWTNQSLRYIVDYTSTLYRDTSVCFKIDLCNVFCLADIFIRYKNIANWHNFKDV